jgi:hypothetical protein
MDGLSRFEERVERLVEGGFARLFAGHLHPRQVAVQLARAMEDYVHQDKAGRQIAPDDYTVRLSPDDHAALMAEQPELADALAEELVEMARIAGLHLAEYPQVRLTPDQDISPHDVVVEADHQSPHPDSTAAMYLQTAELEAEVPQAVLILGDGLAFPINQPVLNLGRARDNHIVIDDPRVSRQHAQIRLRFGQYLLYDLGSTGGTSVNDEPVHEHTLHSGDVISLAGHTLIYLEEDDPDAQQPGGDTQPTETPSDETPAG